MRRTLLAALVAIPATALLSSPGTAATPKAPAPDSMLSIDASQVVLKKAGKGHTLTLTGTPRQMTWFTDRPERKAGASPLASLPKLWKAGSKTSFAAKPPNAALTAYDARGRARTLIVELSKPRYSARTLTFKATAINTGSIKPGRTYRDASLVIDSTSSDVLVSVFIEQGTDFPQAIVTYTNNTSRRLPSGTILTVTLANPVSDIFVNPTLQPFPFSTATYANGVITVVTDQRVRPGEIGALQVTNPTLGSYTFAATACSSSEGQCSLI